MDPVSYTHLDVYKRQTWHSGGARLGDGVLSLHGVGEIFHAMTQASGKIPQISVVLGLSLIHN